MAKSILVGKKPTNYEVEILDKPISKSKFSSALKPYKKVLVVTDCLLYTSDAADE